MEAEILGLQKKKKKMSIRKSILNRTVNHRIIYLSRFCKHVNRRGKINKYINTSIVKVIYI